MASILRVQSGRGLIHEDYPRIAHEADAYGQSALHSSGELVHFEVSLLLKIDFFEGFLHLRLFVGSPHSP
jgi:hypothetical protein